jgi:hypothetical protein
LFGHRGERNGCYVETVFLNQSEQQVERPIEDVDANPAGGAFGRCDCGC